MKAKIHKIDYYHDDSSKKQVGPQFVNENIKISNTRSNLLTAYACSNPLDNEHCPPTILSHSQSLKTFSYFEMPWAIDNICTASFNIWLICDTKDFANDIFCIAFHPIYNDEKFAYKSLESNQNMGLYFITLDLPDTYSYRHMKPPFGLFMK